MCIFTINKLEENYKTEVKTRGPESDGKRRVSQILGGCKMSDDNISRQKVVDYKLTNRNNFAVFKAIKKSHHHIKITLIFKLCHLSKQGFKKNSFHVKHSIVNLRTFKPWLYFYEWRAHEISPIDNLTALYIVGTDDWIFEGLILWLKFT